MGIEMEDSSMEICSGNVSCPLMLLSDIDALWENDDLNRELCQLTFFNWTAFQKLAGTLLCEADWHVFSCWPPVEAGSLAVIPCPDIINGITYTYRVPANATRQCHENGTWNSFDNYHECNAHGVPDLSSVPAQSASVGSQISTVLYCVGYALSLTTCLLAICIYARFRTLCRLRNVIHLNLITTYVFTSLAWAALTVYMHLLSDPLTQADRILKGMIVTFIYCQMTTFFWTLCEGIYMTCILFKPHKLEQLTFCPFGGLGWVLPALILLVWVLIKFRYDENGDLVDVMGRFNYIYVIPILAILAVNLMLLVISLRTILQKQSGRANQTTSGFGRGVKSFLILLPLLGLTYVIILVQPKNEGRWKTFFKIITAILLPTQGFFVAVLYCFCNRQVRGLLNFHCFRKLKRLGCLPRNPEIRTHETGKDISSANNNFNVRSFKGNSNELQYFLKARKSQERFARTESFRADLDSVKLNRLSSRTSRSKTPVVVV